MDIERHLKSKVHIKREKAQNATPVQVSLEAKAERDKNRIALKKKKVKAKLKQLDQRKKREEVVKK